MLVTVACVVVAGAGYALVIRELLRERRES